MLLDVCSINVLKWVLPKCSKSSDAEISAQLCAGCRNICKPLCCINVLKWVLQKYLQKCILQKSAKMCPAGKSANMCTPKIFTYTLKQTVETIIMKTGQFMLDVWANNEINCAMFKHELDQT